MYLENWDRYRDLLQIFSLENLKKNDLVLIVDPTWKFSSIETHLWYIHSVNTDMIKVKNYRSGQYNTLTSDDIRNIFLLRKDKFAHYYI